jgi:hypothetical protein
MYPYERSLVEKHKDEAFVMIGVNSDSSAKALEKTLNDESVNWRSFRDGGPGGSIAKLWNISAWPTIYLLDASGRIRCKNIRGQALGQSIELLLAEQKGNGTFWSGASTEYSDGAVMWSGTPRGKVQIRRNRRLPAHQGWCQNTIDSDELHHIARRHQEVLHKGRELQENSKTA